MTIFIQTLDDHVHERLEKKARQRGITVQQLIRAIIIPEWLKDNHNDVRPARETWPYPRLSVSRPLEASDEPDKE